MGIKNRALLLEAIEEDCLTRWVYEDVDGNYCAIGGLLRKAGFKGGLKQMRDGTIDLPIEGKLDSTTTKNSRLEKWRQILLEKFGLETQELRRIQKDNDKYYTPEARREAIKEYVATLPDEEA